MNASFSPVGDVSERAASALRERAQRAETPATPVPQINPLSTLNSDGSRRWLTPKPAKGRFLSARRIVAWVLIAIFTIIPHLSMNGKPLVLLDLAHRRFTLFGTTFLPTDTVLMALILVGVFLTIFLLTALFGRVWCGWACPQTVYMEFVYRPLERLFQGAPGRAKNWLARSGVGVPLKYASYLLISLFLAHTFLSYFVGVDTLRQWMTQSPFNHPGPFLVMAVVTALMMFDFAFFREQTCIIACPYGRFQSALLDRDSLIVTYDRARGEPRGKGSPAKAGARKAGSADVALPVLVDPVLATPFSTVNELSKRGDCVDCSMCVTCCPTGIDIRKGLQMECIGCAQCIDACDAVMTKLKRPIGLIRYSSATALKGERRRIVRPRVAIYSVALAIVSTLFVIALGTRGEAYVSVIRGLGRPYTELPSGIITNPIKLKVINLTDEALSFEVGAVPGPSVATAGSPAGVKATPGEVEASPVRVVSDEFPIRLEPGESRVVPALIEAPGELFRAGTLQTRVVVTGGAALHRELPFRLMGPARPTPKPASPSSSGAGAGEHSEGEGKR
ncbi:MAG: cytochrome c oxidase accessory protein CcoG [Planctomycetota bacterium]|nr:cytochrome c oxidase accessory protein CcoG [Planctomycetota bacterium]